MNKFFRNSALSALALVGAAASMPASAAIDVTAVVSEITSAVAPVGLIGGAVLLVFVTAAVYKWVRKAL